MSSPLPAGRHRAPRTATNVRALRTGVAVAISAGLATAGALPASANSGGVESPSSPMETTSTTMESTSTQPPATISWTPASPGTSAPQAAVATSTTSSRASTILAQAQRYTGIPYQWGGSGPAGFDCSGYTQFVFAKAGISIPRGTEAQRRAATAVSSPAPGDLVFWGAPAYHVAIYAGDGMIYDAGRPGLLTQKRPMFSGVSSFGRIG